MKRREHAMYGPLAAYLQDRVQCAAVRRVGEGKQLRLSVPDPHKRIPDVIGARETARGWDTHVIEAKPSQGGAAAIPQALGQLSAIAPWSDFLYLALEHPAWDSRSGPAQRHVEGELGRLGFGLLLVKGETVEAVVEPTRNKEVDTKRKNEVLTELNVLTPGVKALPSLRLSLADAQIAAGVYAATLEAIGWIAAEWTQTFKQRPPRTLTSHEWDLEEQPPYSSIETRLKSPDGSVWVDADPFGFAYAADGEPRGWIWRRVAAPEPLLSSKTLQLLRGW